MRDSNSLFVHDHLPGHSLISVCSRCSLASGNLTLLASVSISIPKNTSLVVGPCILRGATGTPRCAQHSRAFSSACAHSSDPVSEKSHRDSASRSPLDTFICRDDDTKFNRKIHCSVSATTLNILGANLKPNGSVVSM